MNNKDSPALYAFRKYGDTVLRTAFACTGSYSEAEDITQEIFLTLHMNPQSFNDEGHLKAWLLRSAINRSKNYKKSFRISRTDSLDEIGENIQDCGFTSRDDELREQIAKLPEKYASVLYLYYYEEYTIREIAELLQKNENTVSSLLQRARKKLKLELEEEGYYETE